MPNQYIYQATKENFIKLNPAGGGRLWVPNEYMYQASKEKCLSVEPRGKLEDKIPSEGPKQFIDSVFEELYRYRKL